MGRIAASVDNVSDHAIHGWIANLDDPARLETVVVESPGRNALPFRACLPRADICNRLALPGRFGFSIPFNALEGAGPVIQLRDGNGDVLPRGDRIARQPRSTADRPQDPAWAILHIQKTAGTSLRTALLGMVRAGESLCLYPDGFTGITPQEMRALPHRQRAALRMVMGHAPLHAFLCLPRPIEFITVLRGTEARLRSNYYHHLHAQSALERGLARSIATLVEQGERDEFDNLAVRMITGLTMPRLPAGAITEAHVDRAMDTLRTRFRFVARQEALATQFPALCRALGARPRPLPHENTQRIPVDPAAERAIDWDRVLHANRFDTMLYDRVTAEGLDGRDLLPLHHRTRLD